MPRPDPLPSVRESERAALWARFRRMMRWMAVAAVVTVLLALIYLKSSGEPVSVHMQIATVLGVGFSVLVGAGLMALVFLSSRSGHDDEAAQAGQVEDDE